MDTDKIDFRLTLHKSCIHDLKQDTLDKYRFATGVVRIRRREDFRLTPIVTHLQPMASEVISRNASESLGKEPNNQLLLNGVLKKLGTVAAHKL